MRGYFGIGIYHTKTEINIGTLWRSAFVFGASFIFTIGRRYKTQASDTPKAPRHIPLYNFVDWDDFTNHTPMDCQRVFIELAPNSVALPEFKHPERAVYILGAEDHGIPQTLLDGKTVVQIPAVREFCLNVATTGSIVMYDRMVKNI